MPYGHVHYAPNIIYLKKQNTKERKCYMDTRLGFHKCLNKIQIWWSKLSYKVRSLYQIGSLQGIQKKFFQNNLIFFFFGYKQLNLYWAAHKFHHSDSPHQALPIYLLENSQSIIYSVFEKERWIYDCLKEYIDAFIV